MSRIDPPPVTHWHELMRFLSELTKKLKAGEDTLEIAGRALNGVVSYIEHQNTIKEEGVTAPLVQLQFAIADLVRGGTPELFDTKYRREIRLSPARRGGPDLHYTDDLIRSIAVTCVRMLVEADFAPTQAADLVARETNRRNLLLKPNHLNKGASILKIYRESGRSDLTETQIKLFEQVRPRFGGVADQEAAKKEACIILTRLQKQLFPATPRVSGKDI